MTEIHLGACKAVDLNCFGNRVQRVQQNLNPKVENHMAGRPGGTDIPTLLNADILALRPPTKDPPKQGVHIWK
jgi:hypothetical protein